MKNASRVSLIVAVMVPSVAPAQEPPPRPFLRKVIQLDDAQLAAVEKGAVVTKLLPTTEKAEVAAFGVVKAAGTVDLLLLWLCTRLDTFTASLGPRDTLSSAARRSASKGGAFVSHHSRASS